MLRLSALLGTTFAVVLLAAGAGVASSSATPSVYVGQWTADPSSQGPAASQVSRIESSSEDTARTDAGTNSPNFDAYCASSNPAVPPVSYFTVANSAGTFGGCVSAKTGGHVYTWNTGQVWYAHTDTVKGEPVLKGDFVPSGDTHYAFTAHHPAVTFLTHVRFTHILKAGSHVAELTTMKGAGEVHIVQVPQPCGSGTLAYDASVLTGSGAVVVTIAKIGGPRVVELSSLTVEPLADQSGSKAAFNCDDRQRLDRVEVKVTKSDPAEKDACPVGAPGLLSLLDAPSARHDAVRLEVPQCHVDSLLLAAKATKHSHVAVAETLDQGGY